MRTSSVHAASTRTCTHARTGTHTQESDLGLTPNNDGACIRLGLPQLTQVRGSGAHRPQASCLRAVHARRTRLLRSCAAVHNAQRPAQLLAPALRAPQERRKDLVKQVGKYGEDAKVRTAARPDAGSPCRAAMLCFAVPPHRPLIRMGCRPCAIRPRLVVRACFRYSSHSQGGEVYLKKARTTNRGRMARARVARATLGCPLQRPLALWQGTGAACGAA